MPYRSFVMIIFRFIIIPGLVLKTPRKVVMRYNSDIIFHALKPKRAPYRARAPDSGPQFRWKRGRNAQWYAKCLRNSGYIQFAKNMIRAVTRFYSVGHSRLWPALPLTMETHHIQFHRNSSIIQLAEKREIITIRDPYLEGEIARPNSDEIILIRGKRETFFLWNPVIRCISSPFKT